MRYFILWDGTQEVQGVGVGFIDKLPPAAAGQSWVEITESPATHTCDATGATILRPRILAIEAVNKWTAAKAFRASKMAAGCATPLGVVQTDPSSRNLIMQAATDATNNKLTVPAWSISWVMRDNTVKAHTALQMIALAAAVRTYITGCQTASQATRTAIFAATTLAALDAIDITAGYPASS